MSSSLYSSDDRLLLVLDRADAFVAAADELQARLQRGRLELAYSRSSRGSLTGASLAYVPRGALCAALRVRAATDGAGPSLVTVPREGSGAPPSPSQPLPTRSRPPALLAGLRRRYKEGGSSGVVAGVEPIGPPAAAADEGGDDDGESGQEDSGLLHDLARFRGGPAGGGEPLQWFGANASPSLVKARAEFADALRLAVATAGAQQALRMALDAEDGCREPFTYCLNRSE